MGLQDMQERLKESQHSREEAQIERKYGNRVQVIIQVKKGDRVAMKEVEMLMAHGWRIVTTSTPNQGRSALKTVALAAVFLPLALLGGRKSVVEYILERPQIPTN